MNNSRTNTWLDSRDVYRNTYKIKGNSFPQYLMIIKIVTRCGMKLNVRKKEMSEKIKKKKY